MKYLSIIGWIVIANAQKNGWTFDPPAQNYPYFYEWSKSSQQFQKKYQQLPANSSSLQKNFLNPTFKQAWVGESHARQDVFVRKLFKGLENGYFVDLAANDWVEYSNTYRLEAYKNWNGICIEPHPVYREGLLANRKCKLFVNPVGDSDHDTVTFRFNEAFSGIVDERFDNKQLTNVSHVAMHETTFNTVKLETILDFAKAPTTIQYLSLDIEGAEYYALKNFNFEKYSFLIITVERPSEKLHDLLTRHGYFFIKILIDYGDCLYAHRSFPKINQLWVTFRSIDPNPIWTILIKNKGVQQRVPYILSPKLQINLTAYQRLDEFPVPKRLQKSRKQEFPRAKASGVRSRANAKSMNFPKTPVGMN